MIRAMIIDDEALSVASLKRKLDAFPDITVVKSYTDQTHILEDIKEEGIDVAFLDIEMAGLNGLDLADAILSVQPMTHIVFVTAHSGYAVRAFDINSIDYLLKPVTSKRLEKTIDRLTERVENPPPSIADETTAGTLAVNCFGEFQAFYDNKLLHFRTAKVKELFAFLLTHMNKFIHRDIIIESLWPGQDYKKSKVNLHTCISHLRKMLNQLGYKNPITFSNQSYSLSIDGIDCDAIQFNTAMQNLSQLNEENIETAQNAMQLYKGPYLAVNGYDWTTDITQVYDEKVMRLLDQLVQYFHSVDTNKALDYLQFQRKLAPYLDENIKQSMQLYLQLDNCTKAIKLYQDYKNLLQSDLGIEPAPGLTALYDELFLS